MINKDRVHKFNSAQPKLRFFSVKICFKTTHEDQSQLAFSYVSEVIG